MTLIDRSPQRIIVIVRLHGRRARARGGIGQRAKNGALNCVYLGVAEWMADVNLSDNCIFVRAMTERAVARWAVVDTCTGRGGLKLCGRREPGPLLYPYSERLRGLVLRQNPGPFFLRRAHARARFFFRFEFIRARARERRANRSLQNDGRFTYR